MVTVPPANVVFTKPIPVQEGVLLIKTKLPPGHSYPQLSKAPVTNYADFLNFFRDGHTIDDNTELTTAHTVQNAMFRAAIASAHLTKAKNMAIPEESLLDVSLTKAGAELIQSALDRAFCEMAIAEARKSVGEDDRLHPYVGVVIVKDGNILATGFRGESGAGDHGEYCALKKLNETNAQGATVYTTLEPCSTRSSKKKPCTIRLIESKVARVVYAMADKHESVFGHASLVEAGIEIGVFPNDLMPNLLALNKRWSDSLRVKPIVPPNDTNAIASVSYYKIGTSMQDNIHLYVRPPKDSSGFHTVEDAAKNVLAHGRTIEDIAIEWHKIDDHKRIVEKLVRQSHGASHQLLLLN
jgi:pyrimidine deaminase RibD-like protein